MNKQSLYLIQGFEDVEEEPDETAVSGDTTLYEFKLWVLTRDGAVIRVSKDLNRRYTKCKSVYLSLSRPSQLREGRSWQPC